MAMVPIKNANPMKCKDSTTGKAHSGPFIAWAAALSPSHSMNFRTVI